GVGAECQRLGDIAAIANATGIDQRDLATLAKVVDGTARLTDGGNARDAGILGGDVRAGPGRSLHAVDVDRVGIALHRHPDVVIDASRAQLELDRYLVIGRFADLLDLQREVVRSQPVGMTCRRSLVDAGRQRSHFGNLVGYLLTHQMPAEADLAALTDEELAGVGEPEMVRIEAVARLDALVQPLDGVAPLVRYQAALSGSGRRSCYRCAARERNLGFVGERDETHARDVNGYVEHHRPLGAGADDGLGVAFLPIALDDEARERVGQERQ